MDFIKQVVCGIARKDVAEAWFNAHSNKRKKTTLFPFFMRSQLRMAERDANFFVWVCWVWHAQVHGHVEVIALCSKTRLKNWFIESWITCVDHDVSFCAGY